MSGRRLVTLLILTTLVWGCDGGPLGPADDLAAVQARWRAANLASYDMEGAFPKLGRRRSVRTGSPPGQYVCG